jgi:hypothetical protein
MGTLNWLRIVLCGAVAGVVFTLLSAVLLGAFGDEFFKLIAARNPTGNITANSGPGLFLVSSAPAIVAMWFYALARAGASSRLQAVCMASLGWWLLATLQSLKWVLLRNIPAAAFLPLLSSLVPTLIAVAVGAMLNGDTKR